MKKKFPLHLKILIGMVLGVVFGLIMSKMGVPVNQETQKIKEYKSLLADYQRQKESINDRLIKLDEFFAKGLGAKSDLLEKETLQQNLKNINKEIASLKPKTRIANSKGKTFIINWIKPWGTIFVNLLKLIAIPLIVASLLKGISDLKDISKFAKIGGRSILIYIGTTIVAITIGLFAVNIVKPGSGISKETINQLTETYAGNSSIEKKISTASQQIESGPLDFLVDMVPSNLFDALSHNGSMLQVIFFIIFFGIAMLLVPEEKSKPIKDFFDGLNDIVLKMVGKLIPDAVMFDGDYTDIDTEERWKLWFEDWAMTYKDFDNRIIPIITTRGNHELTNKDLVNFFDCPAKNNAYNVELGGNLVNIINLNTEISIASQRAFLKRTLEQHQNFYWQIPQYHRACRPHIKWKLKHRIPKLIYKYWIPLLEKYGVRLALECDSHLTKTTYPIKRKKGKDDGGFVRDDENGIVYVGEGCWGAPLRTPDVDWTWTKSKGKVDSFKWFWISQNDIEVRTVIYTNVDSIPSLTDNTRFTEPKGLKLWPGNGQKEAVIHHVNCPK
jgi:uncharacterized protein YggT (Ycf19 family)